MSDYRAPVEEMRFLIEEIVGLSEIRQLPGCEEASEDVVSAILDEAAKFAGEVLAPLNRVGDKTGCRLEGDTVITPPGWQEAYHQFCEAGWGGLTAPAEFGGQGLPNSLGVAVEEMWNAANMSFALGPMLTTGAVDALLTAASPEIKSIYLPKMISGQWTGTMNLTEPQAGSDLALIRTRAQPQPDGTYRLFGQKIFITYGEHDLAENIIHLVLARLPDAPAGVKGISLFVVPKFLVNADGSLGARNDVRCVSIEHKLGIHASPTCVMAYGDAGGAVGYLVGEPNAGLKYMFIMMNAARHAVGVQGVAIAERAFQQALTYARERKQGRDLASGEGPVSIDRHPDVQRMLLTIKTRIEAYRALAYYASGLFDRAYHHPDTKERELALMMGELFIPLVKGGATEMSIEATSLAVQVHGGMGYVEETGAAQHFRDARITTIYEGTTGIQANDLIGRKLMRDQGATLMRLLGMVETTCKELAGSGDADLAPIGAHLAKALAAWGEAARWIGENLKGNILGVFAGSVPFLELSSRVAGGWLLAKSAQIAKRRLSEGVGNARFYQAKIASARFYADHQLPQARALAQSIRSYDATTLQAYASALFAYD
ncbi:acyl-CoA dehydrogenase C-terminal domain-containing protein [Sulfuricystis multivorans]|uniref:acyl-CoA dehydrogenase C-terminal domain-containing protein n=1 Tax=Sulfuricystis multivorans TaxID=2211108 RepID=UPI000F823AB2|nr:acyl-CoA dehydrogenase C-terminal domain-containing protein [Sulfuricystis multivorans]